jgi:hypothetical protein
LRLGDNERIGTVAATSTREHRVDFARRPLHRLAWVEKQAAEVFRPLGNFVILGCQLPKDLAGRTIRPSAIASAINAHTLGKVAGG